MSTIICPGCGTKYSVSAGLAARQRICPKCRTALANLSDHAEAPPVRRKEEPAFPTVAIEAVPPSAPSDPEEPRPRRRRRPTSEKPEPSTDGPGVISLIFGCLAIACLLMGCFTFGLTYFAALPFALVGAGLAFFGRGNLRVACITLNLIVLIPAIALTILLLVGALGSMLHQSPEKWQPPTILSRPY